MYPRARHGEEDRTPEPKEVALLVVGFPQEDLAGMHSPGREARSNSVAVEAGVPCDQLKCPNHFKQDKVDPPPPPVKPLLLQLALATPNRYLHPMPPH